MLTLMFTGCGGGVQEEGSGILTEDWDTPFGLPPFERIEIRDYKPALEAGMAHQNAVIGEILSSDQPPTVENTLLAFAYSGLELERVEAIFENLNAADTNPEMQALAREFAPLLAAHSDNIYLNRALYERLQALDSLEMDWELRRLLEVNLQRFTRAGVKLDTAGQARLREINQRLSVLELEFGDNVLHETNSYRLTLDSTQLDGLPESVLASAREDALAAGVEDGWVFTPHKPSMLPFLTYSSRPELRKELYALYYLRGDRSDAYDNKEHIAEMVNLRLERAQLLGYPSHAAYVLDRSMAKTPAAVEKFMMDLWPSALAKAREERGRLERMMHDEGGQGTMLASDWWHYAEKVRLKDYDLDEEMLRPYFSLDSARAGIFEIARRLYGLQFIRLDDVPRYHPDVEAYEVREEDGRHLAVIYFDFFPRPGKGAGAWCTSFRSHRIDPDGTEVHPIVSIVCNFSRPTGDKPALLLFDEVETMFHEFGHALHSFFSVEKYPSLGSVPRDFVEMPSQVMEHWASAPEFLRVYARHYQSGEPMPEDLIGKINRSAKFNQGFLTLEYMAAAMLDLRFHTLEAPLASDVSTFEKEAMDSLGLIPEILPRYRSTYFSHIFDGGYSAGYYSYLWSEALDCDVYDAFVRSGDIFNREVAAQLRSKVLQWGNLKEADVMFRDFRGRDVELTPLLEERGLSLQRENQPAD